MDSESYWIKRAEEREQEWNKKSKGTIERELANYYKQALLRIEDDIAVLYGRFAKDNKLTMLKLVKCLQVMNLSSGECLWKNIWMP